MPKDFFSPENIFRSEIEATALNTGAVQIKGGLSINKSLFVGLSANIAGNLTVQGQITNIGAFPVISTSSGNRTVTYDWGRYFTASNVSREGESHTESLRIAENFGQNPLFYITAIDSNAVGELRLGVGLSTTGLIKMHRNVRFDSEIREAVDINLLNVGDNLTVFRSGHTITSKTSLNVASFSFERFGGKTEIGYVGSGSPRSFISDTASEFLRVLDTKNEVDLLKPLNIDTIRPLASTFLTIDNQVQVSGQAVLGYTFASSVYNSRFGAIMREPVFSATSDDIMAVYASGEFDYTDSLFWYARRGTYQLSGSVEANLTGANSGQSSKLIPFLSIDYDESTTTGHITMGSAVQSALGAPSVSINGDNEAFVAIHSDVNVNSGIGNNGVDFRVRRGVSKTTGGGDIFQVDQFISSVQTKFFWIDEVGISNFGEKVNVDNADLEIIGGTAQGLIMESPDGTRYRLTIDNNGGWNSTAI